MASGQGRDLMSTKFCRVKILESAPSDPATVANAIEEFIQKVSHPFLDPVSLQLFAFIARQPPCSTCQATLRVEGCKQACGLHGFQDPDVGQDVLHNLTTAACTLRTLESESHPM